MNEKELARKARNQYLREWRRRNPDKVKEYQQNYWERIAQANKENETNAN